MDLDLPGWDRMGDSMIRKTKTSKKYKELSMSFDDYPLDSDDDDTLENDVRDTQLVKGKR